jgi:hypothetical protein
LESIQKFAQLFQNSNPDNQLKVERKISRKNLINILNYINFQDGTIFINFKHIKYGNIMSLKARPLPCHENTLDCLWVQTSELTQKLCPYKFLNFLVDDGQKLILVQADLKSINEERISFDLPEICDELSSRGVRRHLCEGIQVEFIQNSVIFYGSLLDFSAVSLRVEVSTVPPQTFLWVHPEANVTIILKDGQEILFSGECKIIRQTYGQKTRAFVLEPVNKQIHRFNRKEIRSPRYKLSPSPNIIFRHPLTRKMINLEVEDLAGYGFSVEEYYEHSVLLTGMIIPELHIEFANDFRIRCRAQVIYRNAYAIDAIDAKTYVKCGMAILDMDIQEQVRLSSLLHQATNKKSHVCKQVDLEALWRFFFETGFVYPEKYAAVHANKERLKETYEKLYTQNPNIARHFTYQDKGIIHGHISMLRFYENTWLFHHHAAIRSSFKAGLIVLDQIGRYVNDFYCLYSAHMNFVICYFRHDNRFPNRVFGGFTSELSKPKGSSIDPFAYFHFAKTFGHQDLSELWILAKTQSEDLLELESFYEYKSGGIMLNAMDLEPDMIDSEDLNKEYQKAGFKRERRLFSLKKEGILKAIIMVNVSDFGLNMSNLTNCIHIIVLDSDDLPRNVLNSTLSKLSQCYEEDEIPILLYPVSYVEGQSIPYDKIYNLWTINTQYTDHYLKYMENLLNHTQHEKNKDVTVPVSKALPTTE